MLPDGDRHHDLVPSSYRAPDTCVGIGDVDPADVPGVIAQIQGGQAVTPGYEWPKPMFKIVDGEQADALRLDAV